MKVKIYKSNSKPHSLINALTRLFNGYFLLTESYKIIDHQISDSSLFQAINNKKTHNVHFCEFIKPFTKLDTLDKVNLFLKNRESACFKLDLIIDDKYHYFELFPLFLENDEILILLKNISNQEKQTKKLKREAGFLKDFIQNNPFGIEFRDLDGYFISANKAFFDLWGAIPPPDHSILEDHHTELEKQTFRDAANGIYRTNLISCYNPHLVCTDTPDKDYWVNVAVFPIFGIDGEVKQVACMYEDITEKKLQEEELKRLKQKLENRVRERTIKLENAEKKYRKAYNRASCFKGLFNHDMSNIFQIISNSLEMTRYCLEKEDYSHEKISEYITVMEKQLSRGKKLIHNIRNLSEIEESEMPLSRINVSENLNSAIDFVRANFPNRKIDVTINSDPADILVLANELLLDVFENILLNSVMYNKSDIVNIEIEIYKKKRDNERYIKFQFKDNGIGIENERKELIFQKNIGPIRNKYSKGMGLGLSLVAKFIELCKGKIYLEDRIKGDHTRGCNFIILLKEFIEN
ncbi:MAG: putative Histidine kinase [Promethearchaeota archaeon]|nr:MAG: putative Histidine kinase [Candidatus Lokiarchaeota archaeon]